MGFRSQLQFYFDRDSFKKPKGHRVIGLIDDLMILGWNIGVDGSIHVLDKGNDYEFIFFEKKLSSFAKLAELFQYKENMDEQIVIDLDHPDKNNIQLFFNHSSENMIKVELHGEDKELRIINPVKEMNSYLELIYKPILDWGVIKSIKYITGYNYEVIKELSGNNILQIIEEELARRS